MPSAATSQVRCARCQQRVQAQAPDPGALDRRPVIGPESTERRPPVAQPVKHATDAPEIGWCKADPKLLKDRTPDGHQPLATGLVPRKPSLLQEQNAPAAPGQHQGQRRANRASANDRHIGISGHRSINCGSSASGSTQVGPGASRARHRPPGRSGSRSRRRNFAWHRGDHGPAETVPAYSTWVSSQR